MHRTRRIGAGKDDEDPKSPIAAKTYARLPEIPLLRGTWRPATRFTRAWTSNHTGMLSKSILWPFSCVFAGIAKTDCKTGPHDVVDAFELARRLSRRKIAFRSRLAFARTCMRIKAPLNPSTV